MNRSFSLIELLLCIAIMGILMAVGAPLYESVMEDAHKVQLKKELLLLKGELKRFRIEQGYWPQYLTQLCAPIIDKNPANSLLGDGEKTVVYINDDTEEILLDPWKYPYVLEARTAFLVNGENEPMDVPIPPYATPFSVWVGSEAPQATEKVDDLYWIYVGDERIKEHVPQNPVKIN